MDDCSKYDPVHPYVRGHIQESQRIASARAFSLLWHARIQYEGDTSISFAFKNGFLMYHVEVRKVRTNITSSFFPESSRDSGECLDQFPCQSAFNFKPWNRDTGR